ncbi:ATP-binding cassette domain-containing protein [Paracoccus sp. DMF-8]|uniref:ABC transporter ATP-binding protein n=1 Tax=Paracoccus sp. DMF-8 TaxID=3019445 RepID=UPI0023E39500|nr:ATP-binding cassette domain-containing protein [Paracoccus sp. DMF-8]MDF3607609.1 ATP-binding cassette domain-containing protein [Paracoccus sp. DMF-8]
MVVLTGPSGSGKTTLLYLLSGLLVPTAGRIDWQGCDIARLSGSARDRWRRENASFVFQDFQLVPELSPVDNVLVPAWFTSFSAARLRDRAGSLLRRFGVPDRRRASLLSRGEQQRVALARALLLSPAVIFADEPTASLDAASGAEVIATLSALARDEGHSIIIASHDPALIARADLRLELERGQKVTIR